MKSLMANPKTTVGGLLTMIVGVAGLFGVHVGDMPMSYEAAIGLIVAGYTGLMAKDFNVTGGTAKQ